MITKELIYQVISDQRQNFLKKDPGILREALKQIEKYLNLPHINVITGIRRCGKSTVLRQIARQFFNDSDFYYLNFEDERLLNFDPAQFNEIYEAQVGLFGEKRTFFIDEIQHVPNFDVFIRRFYDNNFKFFLTGSNADLLKKEISTRLTGRHLDIYLTPFSFKEFLEFKKIDYTKDSIHLTEDRARLKKGFYEYLTQGGMPEYLKYDELEIIKQTYDDIIIKDIFVRNNVENRTAAKELYQFIISNFAQRFSYRSVQKIIPLGSSNTIKNYLQYLEDSYMVKMISKFDFSHKKQLVNDKKAYVTDNGFIRIISVRPGTDKGWLLENVVANKIGKENDFYYFSGKRECDFIVKSDNSINMAIQVCWELNYSNTDREVLGLIEALEYFNLQQGLLFTSDHEEIRVVNNRTILIKPVWKWLLEN
jgi:uncharacterized protein